MHAKAVFPLFYIPPIPWFQKFLQYSDAFIFEKEEHYVKQTYRNRSSIYSPNGQLDLVVPVLHGQNAHTKMKDVKICNDFNWQREQWMSLQSCYRSSSYFEFYEDDIAHLFTKEFRFLVDLNLEWIEFLFRKLKLTVEIVFSSTYLEPKRIEKDFRTNIHPKRTSVVTNQCVYSQVFGAKYGFIPNLSIIDLLFNKGPQTKNYLETSTVRP